MPVGWGWSTCGRGLSAFKWLVSAAVALLLSFVLLVVVIIGAGSALPAQASCNITAGGGASVTISAGQTVYVRMIIGVGRARGVPQKGWVVALATALQESGLRNLSNPTYPASLPLSTDGQGTNRDSLGVFQQRPQSGWGSVQQLMDPVYEATAFYGGPGVSPTNLGLLDVPGWEALPVSVAAQQIQGSAYPAAYAKWEAAATQLAAANADAPPVAVHNAPPGGPPNPPGGFTGANGRCGAGGVLPVGAVGDAAVVLAQARHWLGTPYSWGGGTLDGPSEGFAQGAGIIGFDCSSYTRYAYFHGAGITLPRTAADQYAATASRTVVTGNLVLSVLQPGDLLFWGSSAGSIHHVAIYAGAGKMLDEPHTGGVGQLIDVYDSDFYAATRPLAAAATTAVTGT